MPNTKIEIYRSELAKAGMMDGYMVANRDFTEVLLEGVSLTADKLRAVADALEKAQAATNEE